MSKIPKTVSQKTIDEIFDRGYQAGLKDGRKQLSKTIYTRAWVNGVRMAIKLQPRYYRPHHRDLNKVLDPYFESLRKAIKNPPRTRS